MPEEVGSGFEMPEELREVERALGGLMPARSAINRDQLMYEAGRAGAMRAERGRRRVWQGVSGVLVLVCVGMGLWRGGKQTINGQEARGAGMAHGRTTPPEEVNALTPERNEMFGWKMPAVFRGGMGGPLNREASDEGGGGSRTYAPALRTQDGLNALPRWQKQAALFAGIRS